MKPRFYRLRTRLGLEKLEQRKLFAGDLAGLVVHDFAADGIHDSADIGAAEQTVYLDLNHDGNRAVDEPFAVTDSNGAVGFVGLTAGNYRVGIELPSGWEATGPATGFVDITVMDNQTASFELLARLVRGEAWTYFDSNVSLPSGVSNTASSSDLVTDSNGDVYSAFVLSGTLENGLSKVDGRTGELIWERRFGATFPGADEYHATSAVEVDSAGNIYVAGHTFNLTGSRQGTGTFVMKFDPSGNQLWEHRRAEMMGATGLGGSHVTRPIVFLRLDASDNVYTISRKFDVGFPPTSDLAFLVEKLSSDGQSLWVHSPTAAVSPDEGNGAPVAVDLDSAGNLLVAGGIGQITYLNVFDSSGNRTLEYTDDTALVDAVFDSTGSIRVLYQANDPVASSSHPAVATISADGTTRTAVEYSTPEYVTPVQLLVDPSGHTVISGRSSSASYVDWFVMEGDTQGNILWSDVYNATGINDEFVSNWEHGLALDEAGNVLVTGSAGPDFSIGRNSVLSSVALKYDGVDGTRRYEHVDQSRMGFGLTLASSRDSFFVLTETRNRITKVVDITKSNDNAAPQALADSYVTNVDQTLTISAPGVLANDVDQNGDPLSVVLVTATSNGTLQLAGDGSFVYVPNKGFAGVDTFEYMATDGLANSAPVTVTIEVAAVPPGVGIRIDGGTLVVTGTEGNDVVQIRKVRSQVFVTLSTPSEQFKEQFLSRDVQQVSIDVMAGNDRVYANRFGAVGVTMHLGAGDDFATGSSGPDMIFAGDGDDRVFAGPGDDMVFGDSGRDSLFGEGGNDVVVGGEDSDWLFGGNGRDILIGGAGSDLLNGGGGQDITIGASTIYDEDDDALRVLSNEWNGSGSYATRVNKLRTGDAIEGGLQLKAGLTVVDDDSRDTIFGGIGLDWLFVDHQGNDKDRWWAHPREFADELA